MSIKVKNQNIQFKPRLSEEEEEKEGTKAPQIELLTASSSDFSHRVVVLCLQYYYRSAFQISSDVLYIEVPSFYRKPNI
jgi:hypothetical protein